jgi:hypothetical protein
MRPLVVEVGLAGTMLLVVVVEVERAGMKLPEVEELAEMKLPEEEVVELAEMKLPEEEVVEVELAQTRPLGV